MQAPHHGAAGRRSRRVHATALVVLLGGLTLVSVSLLVDGAWQGAALVGLTILLGAVGRARWVRARVETSRLEALVETMGDAVVVVDAGQLVSWVNRAALDLFGWQRDELLGASLARLIPEDVDERHAADFAGFAAGAEQRRMMGARIDVRGRRRDGSLFPAAVSIGRSLSEVGEEFIAVIRDLTEQEERAAAVAASERRHRVLFDASPIATWEADLAPLRAAAGAPDREPGDEAVVRLVCDVLTPAAPNRAFLDLVGVETPAEVACGSPWDERFEGLPEGLEAFVGAVRDGRGWGRVELDGYAIGKSGPKDLLLTWQVAGDDPDPFSLAILTLRDVTEWKDLSRRAEALSEELRAHRDELQEFVYAASHDLREPMRKVHALTEILVTATDEGLDVDDVADRLRSATGRMQQLLDGLLAYSRVTTHGTGPVEVDLARAAADVVDDCEVLIGDVDGAVHVGDLPVVLAEPTQMAQLLQNLVTNALKYHRPGVPPVVEITGLVVDGRCLLEVRDNGIGIPPADRDRVRRMFERNVRRSDTAGVGIGLALVEKIARRHDGHLVIDESPHGTGTVMRVDLPLAP